MTGAVRNSFARVEREGTRTVATGRQSACCWSTYARAASSLLPRSPCSPRERSRIEQAFSQYLGQERGLARATVVNYLPEVRRFLSWRFATDALRLDDIRLRMSRASSCAMRTHLARGACS